MFFPQNGLDYDDEKLKGMADRAAERAAQDAEDMELPAKARLKKLGLRVLAGVAAVLVIVALIFLCLPGRGM